MRTVLTDEDYCRAAKELGCDPAMVKAVASVESSGSGFTGENPTVLYERHVFYRNAPKDRRRQWADERPDICSPKPYGKGGYGPKAKQYDKVVEAAKLDYSAALKACSWGAFQELGENHAALGYPKVEGFVKDMRAGIDKHLDIFVRSIKWRGLVEPMKNPTLANCRKIAKAYNGPAYEKFDYHTKIYNAYKKFAGKIDCAEDLPVPSQPTVGADPLTPPVAVAPAVTPSEEKGMFDKIADADSKFAVVDTAASRVSNSSWLVTLTTKVGGWFLLLWSIITTHPEWTVAAVILIVAAVWYLNSSKNRGIKKNADTDVSAR